MNFKLKTLALAVGVSSTLAATSSHALIITSTVESASYINVRGNIQNNTSLPDVTTSTEAYGYVPDPNGDWQIYAGHSAASGNNDGTSSVISRGLSFETINSVRAPFDLSTSAKVTHKATITNDSSAAQNLDFNFLISAGNIQLGDSAIYENIGDFMNAGYSATIKLNGNTQWYSAANSELHYYSDNDWLYGYAPRHAELTFSGTSLNGYTHPFGLDGYAWDSYNGQLNLGTLAAGESLTLEYELFTYVNEHFSGEGYSHTPAAYFADPFDFNSHPLFSTENFVEASTAPTSELPEPSGLLLAGSGLAALAFRRRTKKA